MQAGHYNVPQAVIQSQNASRMLYCPTYSNTSSSKKQAGHYNVPQTVTRPQAKCKQDIMRCPTSSKHPETESKQGNDTRSILSLLVCPCRHVNPNILVCQ